MQLISWVVLGLIAGALARWLMPGEDPMSIGATILLGIAGSFVGGFIGNLIWRPVSGSYFHPGNLILSIAGAFLLLWVWRKVRART
jgi:uncharacterized membrane protein YeaQ/YmgE (transglycosylase-associated protein family)